MLLQALMAVRDISRLHDIASIMVRYGFGDVVERLGLTNALKRAGHFLHYDAQYTHLPAATRVRRALEEMGPAFVKLGQVLATRVDLFEPEWIAEFGKLQDNAPPVPYTDIRLQLIEDLGAAPEDIFAHFDTEPLAAASIAQVYRARLTDGTEVVVKVRRPNIRPVIEADLRWLTRLAELAEHEGPDLKIFRPAEVVRQFAISLRHELDFAVESRNAERIALNFADYFDPVDSEKDLTDLKPPIIIPRVYWQWTNERVCVQEYIDGIPGRRLDDVDEAGLDRRILSRRGARAVLKMIVEDGFFHADPHPGNVFYLPGNRIAFIDFGMVGRLTEERREQLIRLLLGLVQHEARRVFEVMLDWTGDGIKDETGLMLEIQIFLDQYHGLPLKQLKIGAMLSDLVTILRQHQMMLPADMALLVKAFISLEGMGRELDPDFDIASEAMPMLEQSLRAHYTAGAFIKRGSRSLVELWTLLAGLPHDISRLLRAARHGKIEVHIEVTHLKHVGNQLDRAVNRMAAGIVVAALIIGSSIVMTVPGAPSLFGIPFFGLTGFLTASVGLLWLLLSIWRSNRADQD
jgi:ubiquinone biosynthesis protein